MVFVNVLLRTLYSMGASLAFSIIFEIRGTKTLVATSVSGGISWLIYDICQTFLKLNYLLPFFLAAIGMTIFSEIMARLQKKPVPLYLLGGLVPLVPGTGIYRTMSLFIEGNQVEFFNVFRATFLSTSVMAAGVLLISSLVRAMNHAKNFYDN